MTADKTLKSTPPPLLRVEQSMKAQSVTAVSTV
jgi:hypothetical protein